MLTSRFRCIRISGIENQDSPFLHISRCCNTANYRPCPNGYIIYLGFSSAIGPIWVSGHSRARDRVDFEHFDHCCTHSYHGERYRYVVSPLPYWLVLIALAVFIGALTQARNLGGSIGLAVCTNVLNDNVKSESSFLSPQQLHDLLQSSETIKTLPPYLQEGVKQTYGTGYDKEIQALTAFGGAAVLATLLMWETKLRRMQ